MTAHPYTTSFETAVIIFGNHLQTSLALLNLEGIRERNSNFSRQ